MDPLQEMIADLAGRIARVNVEAAEWRARALAAEARLAELAEGEAAEESE